MLPGFEAVSLTGMGFLEQVRLFRGARIVLEGTAPDSPTCCGRGRAAAR